MDRNLLSRVWIQIFQDVGEGGVVRATPREKAPVLQFLTGLPPNRKRLSLLFFFLKCICAILPSLKQQSATLDPCVRCVLFTERSNCSRSALWIVRTYSSRGGILPFWREPSVISAAKLIQLSIQCFWSINEDSLCSVLYYYTLVTPMQFDNEIAGPFGCTQWLPGTKDGCAVVGHTVARFLSRFFYFLSSLKGFFFLSYIPLNFSLLPSCA